MDALDSMKNWTFDHRYLAGGVAIATAYILHRMVFKKKDLGIVPAPANTVVLYQIPRGPFAPSMSPFPMKLETYLRIADIPYQNDFKRKMSLKSKTPWISYNGEPVSDSQFIIEFLNSEFKVDLNQWLTAEQKIVAHALRVMVDEHLYWCLVYFRWLYDRNQKSMTLAFPWLLRNLAGVLFLKRALYAQGIGRHSLQEIKAIMMEDLQALSNQLGDRPFLMGDRLTELDCSAFGMLSQMAYHSSDDVTGSLLKDKFPNLYHYCERIRAKVWPDWEDCTTRGGTRPATK